MKNRTFLNKAMAIMTALTVAIQPATAFASEGAQNPTEASSKVKYEGLDDYYSVVVPTTIQLKPDGTANFDVRAEGELDGWGTASYAQQIIIPILNFYIYSIDEEGTRYPGCYLKQDGKEPIFAEFHEEVWDIAASKYMEQEGIENYKDIDSYCLIQFCNPLPNWVRDLTAENIFPEYADNYEGMTQKQFSHSLCGYDFGTKVPITVNLEGNKPVPAGEWKGEIMIDITDSSYKPLSKDVCQEAQEAYDELIANGQ